MEKLTLIKSLEILLSHNVIGVKQFKNRYVGFAGELSFNEWYRNNRNIKNIITGGFFIPTKKTEDPFQSSIYITTSQSAPSSFHYEIYKNLSSLAKNGMYYIIANKDNIKYQNFFNGIKLPVPNLDVLKFDYERNRFINSSIDEIQLHFSIKKDITPKEIPFEMLLHFRSKLQVFSIELFFDLYIERLVFDGLTSFNENRGSPLDIDNFVIGKNKNHDKLLIIEVKVKDLSKKPPIGFGMDVRRVKHLNHLSEISGFDAYYIVKQVKDQVEREFLKWHYIDLKTFSENIKDSDIVRGGTGMNYENSTNYTKICPVEKFKTF